MTSNRRAAPVGPRSPYVEASAAPWYALIFTLPLLLLYEIGLRLAPSDPDGGPRSVEAHRIFAELFGALGVFGAALPAIALVAALLGAHLRRGDQWRVRPGVFAGMAIESLALTLPLLVLNVIRGSLVATAGAPDVADMPLLDRVLISASAGLYEEFLFRMVLLGALAGVLVGAASMSRPGGRWVAIVLSSVAFAWYHEAAAGVQGVDWNLFAFYLLAGVYFGVIYIARGFGITACTHFVYDVLVLTALRSL